MDLSREAILKIVRRRPIPERLIADVINTPELRERRLQDGTMIEGLTEPERLALLAASHGLSEAMIAETLEKSLETIKTQLKTARRVLQAKNTTHAIAIALRHGLIE